VLADIARLEGGQPTSASVVAHLSSEDAAERVAWLQASARAALAAVNGPTPQRANFSVDRGWSGEALEPDQDAPEDARAT
jgi:hypothetical protein